MSSDVTTDMCRDLTCDTNSNPSPSAHPQTSATQLELREIAAVDADISTVVQYNQVCSYGLQQLNLRSDQLICSSASQMGHADAPIKVGRPIGLNIDTTMKTYESRVAMPSILPYQDETHSDALTASETHTVDAYGMNNTVNETAAKDPPFSSSKALKRKKRMSLKGISVAKSSSLIPPERSPPLSPPPENLQPPSSFPATLTPPGSPSDTCQTPEKFSPSIVVSTPTSATPILLEPSRPIPPMAISSPQALPRIGTPQRPYYSTIRAHLRNNANISSPRLSTTSTPSTPVDGDPRLIYSDRIGVSVLEGEETYQPSPAVLPSVLAPSHIFPLIPVQMYSQPSSPPTHILSALDPGYNDDEESQYIRSGTISARLRRVLRKRSSLWSCLGQKGGQPFEVSETKSEKEVHYTTAMPALFPSRSFGSFGNMSGCSMSGEIEMRMAMAERNHNIDGVQSASAFRFHPTPRPNYHEGHLGRKKGNGRTLTKIRSSIGLSSRTSLTSLPPSPSRHNIGSKLKEMSASFFSKFSG